MQSGGSLAALIALMALGALAPRAALAQIRPGYEARFLGWNPDSSDFAYVRTRIWRRGTRRDYSFVKRTSPSGVAQPLRLSGSILDRAVRLEYRSEAVDGHRLSPYVQVFTVGVGKTLRVVLEVKRQRLAYAVYLDRADRPGDPERLIGGTFDEVWTEFEAAAWISPDRQWVVVMLRMSTPFEVDAWVEGVRVGEKR